MPIEIDIEQHTDEWMALRAGNPGASNIDKIITRKGERSKQRELYMRKLAAEYLTGKSEEGFKSVHMQNGIEREIEAKTLFEMIYGVEIRQVGLVYKDERKLFHCSPDGLIDPDAVFEMKNPIGSTQVQYLLDNKLPDEYFCQVQMSLYVTERKLCYFMSHYAGLPPLIIEVRRDEAWIKKLDAELNAFNDELAEIVKKLEGLQ